MSIFQVEEVEDDDEVAEIDEDDEVAEIDEDDEVAEVDEDVHILEDDDEAASEDCKKNGESNDCSVGEKKKGHVQKAAKGNEKEEEENKNGEDVITVDDSVEPDIVPKVILFIHFYREMFTYLLGLFVC